MLNFLVRSKYVYKYIVFLNYKFKTESMNKQIPMKSDQKSLWKKGGEDSRKFAELFLPKRKYSTQ
jgi:hypothetical protein